MTWLFTIKSKYDTKSDALSTGGRIAVAFNAVVRGHEFGCQETKRIPLSYGVGTLTEDYFVLPQSTSLTDIQTEKP